MMVLSQILFIGECLDLLLNPALGVFWAVLNFFYEKDLCVFASCSELG